jgi:hypothetical protein
MSGNTFARLVNDVRGIAKVPISQNITKKVVGTLNFTSIDGTLGPGLKEIIKTSKTEGLNTINTRLTDLVSDKKIISDSELDEIINTTVDDQFRTYAPQEITRLLNEGGVNVITFKNDIKTQIKNELDNIIKNDVLDNFAVKTQLYDSATLIKNQLINEATLTRIEELNQSVKASGGYDNPPRVVDNLDEAKKVFKELGDEQKAIADAEARGEPPGKIREMYEKMAKKWGNLTFANKVTVGLGFFGVLVTGIVFISITAICAEERKKFGTKIIKLEREDSYLKITIEKEMYENLCKRDKVDITIYSKYIRNSDSIDFSTSSTIELLSNNVFKIIPGDWNFFQKMPTGVATEESGYGYVDLGSGLRVTDACFLCSVVRVAGGAASLLIDAADAADDALGNPIKKLMDAIKKTVPWVIGVIVLIIIIFILKIFLSR